MSGTRTKSDRRAISILTREQWEICDKVTDLIDFARTVGANRIKCQHGQIEESEYEESVEELGRAYGEFHDFMRSRHIQMMN